MRGVVSLASALSIPLTLTNGEPFPHRNLILFITFVVILVTLVFQGLTLPLIIRKVNYRDPDHLPPEEEQETTIRLKLLHVALQQLEQKHAVTTVRNELVANLKNRLESDIGLTKQHLDSLECDGEQIAEYNRVVTELISAKRSELRQLRRKAEFDDEVIRKEEARLDLEEEKTNHPIH
jgi:NhaP-type Na+/H+ or K+/H+ antiporter